mmetsp:Transcript_28207/g.67907  ORF Transcript_28207/g.67907 Transcript_28207/m.67907 type:complete len:120 (+) Transcript_28207:92-451(+)
MSDHWAAKAGATYHILAHGLTSSAFNLSLTESENYPDSVCSHGPDDIWDMAPIEIDELPSPLRQPCSQGSIFRIFVGSHLITSRMVVATAMMSNLQDMSNGSNSVSAQYMSLNANPYHA